MQLWQLKKGGKTAYTLLLFPVVRATSYPGRDKLLECQVVEGEEEKGLFMVMCNQRARNGRKEGGKKEGELVERTHAGQQKMRGSLGKER